MTVGLVPRRLLVGKRECPKTPINHIGFVTFIGKGDSKHIA